MTRTIQMRLALAGLARRNPACDSEGWPYMRESGKGGYISATQAARKICALQDEVAELTRLLKQYIQDDIPK